MFTYYLSLGTNLGNRTENIDCAIDLLTHRVGKPVSRSALYDTAPVGFASANRFLNAAVVLRSRLTPDEVLQATQLIEREMGRTHKSTDNGYTDRIIDIDILLVETPETPQTPHLVIDTPQFCLPHKHLAERRFVLEPLAEIAPEAWHPLLQCTVSQLLDVLNTAHIAPLRPDDVTDHTAAQINALLPQLSAKATPLRAEALRQIVSRPNVRLYVLHDECAQLCGMATLTLDALVTGTKAWVEDVVVSQTCRGRGYGSQLISHLVAEAKAHGAASVNLTSRPEREAANRLYRRLGFVQRQTNVYKLTL